MKKILIGLGVVLAAAAVYFFFFSGKERPKRVLVFSKTTGFRHDSIEPGQEALKKMGDENGFSVDITEDAAYFTEAKLKEYSTVIFLNTTGDILNNAQQTEFERYIQAGGGYVGIHSATDTEYAWEWYGKLAGAYFESHPLNPNVQEGLVTVVDRAHPATDSIPAEFRRADEWYNFKNMNPAVNVLAKVDESTYKDGKMGDNHPIAWYHNFDGGRAFYTAMGHTKESFTDPIFLRHLLGGIQWAIGANLPLDYSKAYSVNSPEENRFTKVVYAQNLDEPMELDFVANDRILFVERKGGLHLYNISTGEMKPAGRLAVHTGHEDGLLGMAVDPNFAQNNWIYLFYSPVGEVAKQHVSRFEFKGDSLITASEKVLLEIPTQREECCHSAGSLEFGPDGLLYISVGDNTNPHASEGYGPMDEREGRSAWDAQKSASNVNDLRGKILRIKPEADGTYSIPEGNLFPKDGAMGRPEVYVMGCRNPYRIAIDAKRGWLFWGDVGPDANADTTTRGPRGHDEVNLAKAPGFFGWPYFVGNNKPYVDFNFASNTSGTPFDPQKPFNDSPNNTGVRDLPPAQPALLWYPYSSSEEFPLVNRGGNSRNAMAGPVFYSDRYPASDNRFPEYYDGKFFAYDWMRNWILAVTLKEDGSIQRMEPFLPNMKFNNIIDMLFGPDGSMYLLEYGSMWFAQNQDARLVKIEYTAGNRKPVAKIDANKTIGGLPLTVQFSAANSLDFDGDSLTYAWKFDKASEVQSTEQSPSYTFAEPGMYKVHLTVKDPSGETATAETEILVGNELPQLTVSVTNGNRSFYWPNSTLGYAVEVTDVEDGSLSGGQIADNAVTVTFDYMAEGFDLTTVAQGHQAAMEASFSLVGKGLIEQSDCNSCHQLAQRSIGPSYQEIAQRYKDDAYAPAQLAKKIRNGGGGVWGETAMAAHPDLTDAQASQMVAYILGLAKKGNGKSLPAKGSVTANQHQAGNMAGSYVLTATYTDKGAKGAQPLSARQLLVLRSPQVEAEDFNKTNNGMIFPVPDQDVKVVVGSNGTHVLFSQLDLTDVASITARVGLLPGTTVGGIIEVRVGSPDGDLIGQFDIVQNLTSLGFVDFNTKLKPTKGPQDVYFIMVNKEKDGPVCAIDWLRFFHISEKATL